MGEQRTYRPAWHCIDFVLDGTSPINTGIQLWQLDHWKITADIVPSAGNADRATAFACQDESASPYHGMNFRINGANSLNMQFQCNPNMGKKNHTGGNYHVVAEKDGSTLTYTAPNGDVFTADISAITYTGPLTIGDGWKNGDFLGRRFKGTVSIEVMVYADEYLGGQCLSLTSIMRRRQASYIDWSKFAFSVRDNSLFVSYLHSKGLCASKNGITQAECEAVTDMSQIFSSSNSAYLPNLDEFKYFVNIPSRGSVGYPFSRYVKEVTFPQGYTLGWVTFSSTKDDYIKERVTLNGGVFNDLATSFYIDGSHATNGIYVRCFQLFGDVTLMGYDNINGVNSFKYCVMDKVQIEGYINNWWPFMDVGYTVSNRQYWNLPWSNIPELPLKEYTVEFIDAQGNVISENDYYKKIDGSIYTKDGGTLCWYDRTATEVVIPQTCTKLVAGAIGQMPNITRLLIPEWVTEVFYNATWSTRGNFLNMPNLVEFRMEGGTADKSYDGAYLFLRGCPNLRVASMTKLSANSTAFNFAYLTNLRVLTIHSAVKTLNNNISGMTNLQKLHLTNTSVVTTWNANLANITCDIYVPDALVDTYKATTGWVDIADRIKPESEFNETYTE